MIDVNREVEVKEIEIKTAHFRYVAKKWGNPAGIPILALHGWLDNAASFDYLAPLLTEFQLVALDFPGHGFSAHRPLGFRYHYLDYIADVINVVDALKWQRFVLLGHSLGAGVASFTAGAFPDRIIKLILIEGLGAMSKDTREAPKFLAQSIVQMKTLAEKTPPIYKNLEEMINLREKVGDMKRSSIEALVSRGVVQLENGVTWRSDPRLRLTSPGYQTDEQVYAFLEAIRSPVLLVLAENGIFHNREYLETRCGKIKNLQKVIFPGSHHFHLDDPQPIAEAIQKFIHS